MLGKFSFIIPVFVNTKNVPEISNGNAFLSVLCCSYCSLGKLTDIRRNFLVYFDYNYSYLKKITYIVVCCVRDFEVIIL